MKGAWTGQAPSDDAICAEMVDTRDPRVAPRVYNVPLAVAREAVRCHEEFEGVNLHGIDAGHDRLKMTYAARDCGTCRFCRDKTKNGGGNTLKQSCILRQQERKERLLTFAQLEQGYSAKPPAHMRSDRDPDPPQPEP